MDVLRSKPLQKFVNSKLSVERSDLRRMIHHMHCVRVQSGIGKVVFIGRRETFLHHV